MFIFFKPCTYRTGWLPLNDCGQHQDMWVVHLQKFYLVQIDMNYRFHALGINFTLIHGLIKLYHDLHRYLRWILILAYLIGFQLQ